ncbi:LAETG motif-containing sortase-dependent surface protein [Streptomyces colonosanans]|uniref:Peptidase n=1 Tax=Streptomyces colonosanans TaxID=1428652 RepID=A0A1S2PZB6_9ACTN|nr:LAETG motif-containing sortase-dependent surface protein [Streptomyces colonosanans]OIJ99123.1 hypothetical protein BIV24_04935 [Streptomyces colonosanans]
MKLRRALAAAAATAAIAPLALLSAPAAFADDTETPSASVTESAPEQPTTPEPENSTTPPAENTESTTPAATSPAPETSAPESTAPTATPSASATTSAKPTSTASPEPTDEPTEPSGICEEDDATYKSKLNTTINGLPGKIVAGSGWHPFTLTVKNPTKSAAQDVIFYAGVGPNDENAQNPFKASQVQLQAKVDGVWVDIEDEGYSVGFLDLSDVGAGKTVNYQLRLNVKANAPIGTGLTIGGGVYFDEEAECLGADEAHYIIEIVKGGTDTDGTRPQEGGKVPVPTGKPNQTNTQQVTGTLASTGSSSMLPTIALIGGVAVVAGGGAVFAVRRRKTGGVAA